MNDKTNPDQHGKPDSEYESGLKEPPGGVQVGTLNRNTTSEEEMEKHREWFELSHKYPNTVFRGPIIATVLALITGTVIHPIIGFFGAGIVFVVGQSVGERLARWRQRRREEP